MRKKGKVMVIGLAFSARPEFNVYLVKKNTKPRAEPYHIILSRRPPFVARDGNEGRPRVVAICISLLEKE